MGLQTCHSPKGLSAALLTVPSRGEQVIRNLGVLLEKYYSRSRHIKVQVFGNGTETIHFGERECGIQRRHQTVGQLWHITCCPPDKTGALGPICHQIVPQSVCRLAP